MLKDNDTEVNSQDLHWQDVICHLENLDEVYELKEANTWFGGDALDVKDSPWTKLN